MATIWTPGWLERLGQDLYFGIRILWKSKGFAAVALLTLALGIGANSAMFSIVDAVLLRPLPYPNSERLVTLWERRHDVPRNLVTGPDFRDWREQARSYDAVAAVTPDSFNVTGSTEPISYDGLRVSPDFFRLIGVGPFLGRSFLPQEEQLGRSHVAIISAQMWKSSFAGSPGAIAKTLNLNGDVYTIIGVMPSSFKFLNFKSDIWVPLSLDENNDRHAHNLMVVARLGDGISIAQARSELSGIAAELTREYPDTNNGWTVDVVSLRDQVVGGVRNGVLLLLGCVSLVLRIACANTANLLLVRAAGRCREIGIRTALGASSGRITRQLLTESFLLGFVGGVFGLFFAWAAISIPRTLHPGNLPRIDEVHLDATVLWFTTCLSCLAGIVFGLFPAVQSLQHDISESLRSGNSKNHCRSGIGSSSSRRASRLGRKRRDVHTPAAKHVALLLFPGSNIVGPEAFLTTSSENCQSSCVRCAGHKLGSYGGSTRNSYGPSALQHIPVGGLRVHRAFARGHRHLRSCRLQCATARSRDRNQDGDRCYVRGCSSGLLRARDKTSGSWRLSWISRIPGTYSHHRWPSIRSKYLRSD